MKERVFAILMLMVGFVISGMLLTIVGIYVYVSYQALIGISSIIEMVGFVGLQIMGLFVFTIASVFFSGLMLALMADCAKETRIKQLYACFVWLFNKWENLTRLN